MAIAQDLSQVNQTPAHRQQSLTGAFQAQATQILLGQRKSGQYSSIFTEDSPNKLIPTSQSVKTLLQWWSVWETLTQGVTLVTHWVGIHYSQMRRQRVSTKGVLDKAESQLHINCLEMRAVKLALSFQYPTCLQCTGSHRQYYCG